MRKARLVAAILTVLGATVGCSRAEAPREAGSAELPEAGKADSSPDAIGNSDAAGIAPDSRGSDNASDAAMPDLPQPDPVPDGAVAWPGADAKVTIGEVPPLVDGGLCTPIYGFPGTAVLSHSKMFRVQPDTIFRVDQLGEVQYRDVNGDGLGDLVVAKSPNIGVYLQDEAGHFERVRGVSIPTSDFFDAFELADLNGDGLLDVVLHSYAMLSYARGNIGVYLQGKDGFRSTPDSSFPVSPVTSLCDAVTFLAGEDMNGDGRADIVAITKIQNTKTPSGQCGTFEASMVQIFAQDGNGTFALGAEIETPTNDSDCRACAYTAAIGDVDRDGRPDLAVLQEGKLRDVGIPALGYDTLVYTQADGAFGSTPVQALKLAQYLRIVRLADINGDGRLDVVVMPGKNREYAALSSSGLTGVFLQQADGSFADARTITSDLWRPASTDSTKHALGFDVRDLDRDGVLDIRVERNGQPEGLLRQVLGLFATTPDVETATLFPEQVAGMKEWVKVEFIPNDQVLGEEGYLNQLSYGVADMDGDGRTDVVGAYVPFAPNKEPDPATGKYPHEGFEANTYTEIRIHHQRPLTRELLVTIDRTEASAAEMVLHVRATVRNLGKSAADNVRLRLLADSIPGSISYTRETLRTDFPRFLTWGLEEIVRGGTRIKGVAMGADVVVPRIEAGADVPIAIDVPIRLIDRIELHPIFLVADPDESDSLLYRRSYDFIAGK